MVFYFTGTGNSLYIAKKLQQLNNEVIYNMASEIEKEECVYTVLPEETVGFVFPVYYYGIPTIVEKFIDKLTFQGNVAPYLYSIITCGGGIAATDVMIRGKLQKRGYFLSYINFIKMTDNYVIAYNIANKEKQKQDLLFADKKFLDIYQQIKDRSKTGYQSQLAGKITTSLLYPFYKKGRKTKKFTVGEKCTSCGLCMKNCPDHAIEMRDGKPQWTKAQCSQCLGCINRCPAACIQYGKSTEKRGRYVNPEVSFH